MGQQTVGILYGCKAPMRGRDGEDHPAWNLIDKWEKEKKITWSKKGPKIRFESEGGVDLIGVWVAVGGCGEDEAPYFLEKAALLDDVHVLFRSRMTLAQKLWNEFVQW